MSAGTLIERKLDKRFQLLDTDGDGYITRKDYELVVQRLVKAYDAEAGAPAAKELHDGYMRLWQGLAAIADANSDGKITRAEFAAAIEAGVLSSDGGYDRILKPAAVALFRLADTDGSGELSPAEVVKLGAALGISEAESTEFFEAVDANGDGEVSVAELLESSRQFYLSTDPDVPGNRMFGQI